MKSFFIYIALIFFAGTLFAAAAATEKESDRIEQLEQRIRKLEEQLAAEQKSANAKELEEIQRELQILAEEVEKLRSGEPEVKLEESRRRSLGLGPSAATVYSKKQGVSLAGYGEMLYENFAGQDE